MLLKNSITEDKTIWAGLNHPELPLEEADIYMYMGAHKASMSRDR